ncbi:hypothetical protein SUNI508_12286 [Seiridium unicorne]|uniref:Uncharacterized protein n=1 Tax=Seiridium unicorne TaxID=138068 RepID=A0ABR2UEH9_9PEZI
MTIMIPPKADLTAIPATAAGLLSHGSTVLVANNELFPWIIFNELIVWISGLAQPKLHPSVEAHTPVTVLHLNVPGQHVTTVSTPEMELHADR